MTKEAEIVILLNDLNLKRAIKLNKMLSSLLSFDKDTSNN